MYKKFNFGVQSGGTPLWEVVGGGVLCGFRALGFRVKGVAVPVALHVVLHVVPVLQGTLRNLKGVAVPVALHVVLQGTLQTCRV